MTAFEKWWDAWWFGPGQAWDGRLEEPTRDAFRAGALYAAQCVRSISHPGNPEVEAALQGAADLVRSLMANPEERDGR